MFFVTPILIIVLQYNVCGDVLATIPLDCFSAGLATEISLIANQITLEHMIIIMPSQTLTVTNVCLVNMTVKLAYKSNVSLNAKLI